MKYKSLKRQPIKSFKISQLDGGIDFKKSSENIKNNQLVACENMWYSEQSLKTRPGLKGYAEKTIYTENNSSVDAVRYDVTDTEIYRDGICYRLATAKVLADERSCYIYVYLLDDDQNIISIGKMTFLRLASDTFYIPINTLFFNGKPQTGGGLFAFVTLENKHNRDEKYYYIYEIDAEFREWNRVYDYYVPVISINGRGNKYQIAKSESGFTLPSLRTLESQNMLNGKFCAYYTSDGYSNSFRLPFTKLAIDTVVCRIYYTLVDYVEWRIEANTIQAEKDFFGKKVRAIVDREKGTLYFKSDSGDYAVPVMDMYHENNIKIIATKEIENGFSRIVSSSCCARNNSKLLISGGENGNEIYVSDYDNPLYFPLNSFLIVGESGSPVVALSTFRDKIIAFKPNAIYDLHFKEGGFINEISLLSDNDKTFKEADGFSCEQISWDIGCSNPETVASCGEKCVWLGNDDKIYLLNMNSTGKISTLTDSVCDYIHEAHLSDLKAVCDDKYYFLMNENKVLLCDVTDVKEAGIFFWSVPDFLKIQNAFYSNGQIGFLCNGENSNVTFIAQLNGDSDSFMYEIKEGAIAETCLPIKSSFVTKKYSLSNKHTLKKIEEIYLLVCAKGRVKISVNNMSPVGINFGFSGEDYDRGDYKSVELLPHLYDVDTVYLSVEANNQMSVKEIEILYRNIG